MEILFVDKVAILFLLITAVLIVAYEFFNKTGEVWVQYIMLGLWSTAVTAAMSFIIHLSNELLG